MKPESSVNHSKDSTQPNVTSTDILSDMPSFSDFQKKQQSQSGDQLTDSARPSAESDNNEPDKIKEACEQKYQQYTERLRESLGAQGISELEYRSLLIANKDEAERIATDILQDLSQDELSFFRSEFIRRSRLYDGEEWYSINGSEYQELAYFNQADKDFKNSQEYIEYASNKMQRERAAREERFKADMARIEAEEEAKYQAVREMSPEALHQMRAQRLECMLTGEPPVEYYDENGKFNLEKYEQYQQIKQRWDYDRGWQESKERQEFDRIMENEVMNPDLKKMREFVDSKFDQLDIGKFVEIVNSEHYGFDVGSRIMVTHLSEQLGIPRPEVYVIPRPPEQSLRGHFNRYFDRVTIFNRDESENDDWFAEDIETIAHEVWHAYQFEFTKQHDPSEAERARLYKANFAHYEDSDSDYDAYRTQLLEVEARRFAKRFVDEVVGTKSNKTLAGAIKRFLGVFNHG